MLNDQSIFITGGTGALGKAFLKKVLTEYHNVKKITIYSLDEMKQHDLREQYPADQFPQIEWVIGDIRDSERLAAKIKGANIVIHSAATKHIPICEESPEKYLKTKIEGSKNVIHATINIPIMEATKIVGIANEIAPCCEHKILGFRGFEMVNEQLVSGIELKCFWENDIYWIISLSNDDSSIEPDFTKQVFDISLLDNGAIETVYKYHLN